MTKIRATSGAGKAFYHNHLSCNDYYSEKEKVSGYWRGKLVWDLGLVGLEADAETFSLLQKNINPKTMDKLTQRTVKTGVRFFDFQCAAPKSVSVLSMFDARLIQAHREAVTIAMIELERLAAVRLRKGDQTRTNNYEITGNILYATFLHDASRALDPQLHSHNVVANVTKTADGEFKALESLEMVRAIRYAGKVYHNELARRCREMGYRTVNHLDDKGSIVWFDIEGVSEKIMDKFSKRRAQIEALEQKFIEEHGRKPTLGENNFISMTTRDQKLKEITADKVKNYQIKQLTKNQKWDLEQVIWRAGQNYRPARVADSAGTVEMIQAALPVVYERDSVLKLDKVLAETLNQNFGKVDLKTLKAAVKNVPELKNLGGLEVNPYYSTEKIIQQELYAIESVETQKDLFEPIAVDFVAFPEQETRQKQAELIHGMLSSQDRFNLFRGVAGAGKTSTLQELCKGLRSGGIESIHLIAPTNSATDVLRQEGFEQSQTVASFLLSQEKPLAGSYVIIDESGLNSLREGVEIAKVARANNYRVLFVGDARQHSAVENGDFFRLLEEHSEIERFSLTDIHRQQNEEYRRGISDCALGRFEAAFERFDANGFIHEGKSKYLDRAADSYMEYTENGQFIDRAILVAPTHDEGDKLTDAVRSKLKDFGSIKGDGQTKDVFRSWNWPKARLRDAGNYQPGMAVAFIRNMKDIAKAGETAKIIGIDNGNLLLDNGKAIYARRCAEFIEVGERRTIELCEGDLIQFNVNLRNQRIYNGNIAMITADPGKVMMLYSDGQPRELVDMPTGYDTFKYGWVTTSYKSQGRTAENVVVAAQSLDRKAFYVALSRGRQHMALHCPEKEFLKARLSLNSDRNSVHDLVKAGEIRQDAILNLSAEARDSKAKTLPDTTYKSIKGRAARLMEYVKSLPGRIYESAKHIVARRNRFNKYGYGIVNEDTYFEQGINFAVEARQEIKAQEEPKTEKYPAWNPPPPDNTTKPEPTPYVDKYPAWNPPPPDSTKKPEPTPYVDKYPAWKPSPADDAKQPKPEQQPYGDKYPAWKPSPADGAKQPKPEQQPSVDKYPVWKPSPADGAKQPKSEQQPYEDKYPAWKPSPADSAKQSKPEPSVDKYPAWKPSPTDGVKQSKSEQQPYEDKYPAWKPSPADDAKKPKPEQQPYVDKYPAWKPPPAGTKDKLLEPPDHKTGPELPIITEPEKTKKSKPKDIEHDKQQTKEVVRPEIIRRPPPPPKKKPPRGMDR